jgi:hypothetical protein
MLLHLSEKGVDNDLDATQFDQVSIDNNQQQKREHQGKRGRDKAEQDNQGEDIT